MPKAKPEAIKRGSAGRFQPGRSGNPAGRPRGIQDKRVALRSLLAPHADKLIATAVALALKGDVSALRLCVDRLIPPLKSADEPLPGLSLPDSLADKGRAILAAVTDGRVTVDQGASLLASVGVLARVLEAGELESRIKSLEEALQRWESKTGATGSKD